MSNWNSERDWNKSFIDGGFYYNGADNVYYLNIQDEVKFSDLISVGSIIALADRSNLIDELRLLSLFNSLDFFSTEDESKYFGFFEILDKFDIVGEIENLVVNAYLNDNMELIDELKSFVSVIAEDNIDLSDISNVDALFDLMDSYEMSDLVSEIKQLLSVNDSFNMTDHSPKTAISDFYIGSFGHYDSAYDWFIPFGMKVDYGNTNIQPAPEAEITSIEMPGIDGSIVENTTYKDRMFQITAFSEIGMTREQKEQLKRKITSILDSTKKKSKKLTIGSEGITFDVKYDGQADTSEGPSFVRVSVPLRAKPYGESLLENEVIGNGTIINNGDAPIGAVIKISPKINSVDNPTFSLGEYYYMYYGTINKNCSLVFDNEKLTCYYMDENGKKTNALPKMMCGKDKSLLTKSCQFQKVEPGTTMFISDIPDDVSDMYSTTWKDKILW